MTFYIIKLFIMLPLIGLMIYGCLWLYRKYQPQMMMRPSSGTLNVIETLPLGVQSKLAVVEFDGRKILLAVTRNGIEKIDTNHAEEPENSPGRYAVLRNDICVRPGIRSGRDTGSVGGPRTRSG